jgi:hypothetical protein
MERMEKGLNVGLSIGFSISPEGRMWFENGADLLKHCEEQGMDMSLFDAKGIKACKGMCRAITEVDELYEYSIVTVPMNPRANATAVKSLKSHATSVGAILQAKIHQSFTVAADEIAIRGYVDVAERIQLSSLIGTALQGFAAGLDPDVAARLIDPDDVDEIAEKTVFADAPSLNERPFADHSESVLTAVKEYGVRAADYKATRDEKDRELSSARRAEFAEVRDALDALLALPDQHGEDPESGASTDDEAKETQREESYQALVFRTLAAKSSGRMAS